MENNIKLQNNDGKILVSSRDVAENLGKRHSNVLRDIDNLISGRPDLSREIFRESSYVSDRGKTYREYLMDRDGFSLLVMGYNGKRALQWKLKYLTAFNEMERRLKSDNYASEEDKLKLQLFSKNPDEVRDARNKLLQMTMAITPFVE